MCWDGGEETDAPRGFETLEVRWIGRGPIPESMFGWRWKLRSPRQVGTTAAISPVMLTERPGSGHAAE